MSPGPLHENVVEECSDGAKALKDALPKDDQSRINIRLSTTYIEFSGAYSGSYKIPDLAILVQDDDNSMIPRVIFEIGTSESYNHLKQSAKLSLEGMPGVHACILIKIYELRRTARHK